MSALHKFQTPKPRRSFLQFQLKSEYVKEEFTCPGSPIRPNKTICMTTGHKHIISSKNLNFVQSSRFDSDFQSLGIIGEGMHSWVYKVRSMLDGNLYAIKKIKKACRGKRDREAYLDEVCKHALLSNNDQEHIVRYCDSWEESNHFYIRTELCDSTLSMIAASTHVFDEEKLWQILNDVSRGLMTIHRSNYVHLDIKPANLFVCGEQIRIGDFGHMIESSREVIDEGDILYVAPEVLENKACFASDVFSLGLVLFELAAGVVMPDTGPSWHALRQGAVPVDDLQISEELKEIIFAMTRPDPRHRIALPEILRSQATCNFLVQPTPPPAYEVLEVPIDASSELAINLFDVFNSCSK